MMVTMATPGTIDALLRRLARDQWVRVHGTPRITVLAGDESARTLWARWTALAGLHGTLLDGDFATAMREAAACASADPTAVVAVLTSRDAVLAWRATRDDRLAAMVDEGLLIVPDASAPTDTFDARSAAEAALFEALEATPATAGRFELNGRLSVRFGPTAAEVDLLSRRDRIAIEIDGYHHFTDPDCYRRDRRKDLLLQTQGLLVIRLLAEDVVRDPRDGVNVVCQGLAFRLGGSAA
jgi:very-short-patch-repair endonuclease